MTQGSGGRFYTWDITRFRGVLVKNTAGLSKFSKAFNWEKTPLRQYLEQHGRSMAFAQHEAITFWCFWSLGVNVQFLPIKRCEQFNAGEAGAQVGDAGTG